MNVERDRKRIALAGLAVLVGILVVPWAVRRYSHIAPVKNFNSLSVVLQRTNCLGSCPVYTVTINGNGLVDYSGQQFVRIHGPQTVAIDRAKLDELLQDFDRAHYLAFVNSFGNDCTDMPHVVVSLAVDGRVKRVESDELCPEHPDILRSAYRRLSRQDDFLMLAREIDSITGSDRWVKCDGVCRD
jgi:hypothetical protein